MSNKIGVGVTSWPPTKKEAREWALSWFPEEGELPQKVIPLPFSFYDFVFNWHLSNFNIPSWRWQRRMRAKHGPK